MMLPRARALRLCILLGLPTAVFAQSPKTPTIFSPSAQLGTVSVRAAVVLHDYSIKPLPLLRVTARRNDRADSVVAQTNLEGRTMLTLPVGAWTLRARTAQPVSGRSYAWTVRVVVRPRRTETVELTNANATADSARVVAVAPPPVVEADPPPPRASPVEPRAATPKVPAPPAPNAKGSPAKPGTDKAVPPKAPAPAPVKLPVAPAPAAETPPASPPASAPASPFTPPPSPSPSPWPSMAPVAAAPAPLSANRPTTPRSNTSGLILGLSLNGSAMQSDAFTTSTSTESGAGLAAQLGWGFTRNFAFILDASAARIESVNGNFDLAHVDVAGRWHFASASRALVPYVEVGYAGRAARKQDMLMADDAGTVYTGELALLGGGISLGGGLEYFLTHRVALGGTLKWTTGTFSQVRFDNVTVDGFEIDATSTRFNLGFTFYPTRR